MPNRTIDSNYSQTAKVQIYGSDLNSPLVSSNGLLAASLSGTPTVLVGRLTVESIPPVSFNGTPTVALSPSSPLPITIVNDLVIRGNGHESIYTLLSSTVYNSGTLNVNTPAIDVSQFSEYSYGIQTAAGGTTVGTTGRYVFQPQVSAYNRNTAFVNNGTPLVLTVPSIRTNTHFVLTSNDFARYSRVAMSGNSNTTIGVAVYFQGRY